MRATAFLPELGISIQGQDANGAWRAACHIAQKLGLQLSATFVWREKEGAAFPGITGRFSIAALETALSASSFAFAPLDAPVFQGSPHTAESAGLGQTCDFSASFQSMICGGEGTVAELEAQLASELCITEFQGIFRSANPALDVGPLLPPR
jgi:hypothetical protein